MAISEIDIDVVIFVMPWEINAYRKSVDKLESSVKNHPGINITLHACLCVSDTVIHWGKSKADRKYFIDNFKKINNSLSSIKHQNTTRISENNITGCVDWRRKHIQNCRSGIPVIWLDCDIVFSHDALSLIKKSIDNIVDQYYIITPQIPRMWDETWDCLVHEDFNDKALGYCYDFDVSQIDKSGIDRSILQLNKNPQFKFAGGWLTVLSSDLLKLVCIPETFKPYGEEDTYLMQVCEGLIKQGWSITQYTIQGLLVAQDFNLFNSKKKQLRIINDKDGEAFYNRSIRETAISNTLSRIGLYKEAY